MLGSRAALLFTTLKGVKVDHEVGGSVLMDSGDFGQINREAWCAHMRKVYGSLDLRTSSSFTFVASVQGCQLEL
jgi:hypothetical protein